MDDGDHPYHTWVMAATSGLASLSVAKKVVVIVGCDYSILPYCSAWAQA